MTISAWGRARNRSGEIKANSRWVLCPSQYGGLKDIFRTDVGKIRDMGPRKMLQKASSIILGRFEKSPFLAILGRQGRRGDGCPLLPVWEGVDEGCLADL